MTSDAATPSSLCSATAPTSSSSSSSAPAATSLKQAEDKSIAEAFTFISSSLRVMTSLMVEWADTHVVALLERDVPAEEDLAFFNQVVTSSHQTALNAMNLAVDVVVLAKHLRAAGELSTKSAERLGALLSKDLPAQCDEINAHVANLKKVPVVSVSRADSSFIV